MSSQYAGNPASFPADFTIPDDGELRTASSVNIAFEALGDRTACVGGKKCVPVYVEYLAGATLHVPANAASVFLYDGSGGGGAGGKGGPSRGSNHISAGGGGGGGARKTCGIGTWPAFDEDYTIAIGAGGSGVDVLFGIGNPGADTTVTRVAGGAVILRCRGANGGHSGGLGSLNNDANVVEGAPYPLGGSGAPSNQYAFARGGSPVRCETGLAEPITDSSISAGAHYDRTPGAGGLGTCSTWPLVTVGDQGTIGLPGNPSPEGFAGGASGTQGLHAVGALDYAGGGAGGGGGGGPYGVGGNGGNGANSNGSGGASPAPTAGTNAAANTGAGGGGGGGAACGSPTTTPGAAPGNGGSGRLRIIYFIPAGA